MSFEKTSPWLILTKIAKEPSEVIRYVHQLGKKQNELMRVNSLKYMSTYAINLKASILKLNLLCVFLLYSLKVKSSLHLSSKNRYLVRSLGFAEGVA